MTNALGLVTTETYDADGNVVAQGGAQYPVCYSYDNYGRMRTMSTYRSEDLSHADVTTWLYDEATGLMTNKVYADGKGPTYTYTPDGLLATRTWARGIVTTYSYDTLGNLVSVNYSDTTPDIVYTRDRLGNVLLAVTGGVATNAYAYNRLGQVTNEVQNGTTIARSYDALGRATGYVIGDGEALGSVASYSYDALGRFASVTSGTNVFSYSYLPGSDLVSGMTANTGHAWERIYEPNRNLISAVHNHYGSRTISRFDYTNDEIGRRITRVDSGEAFSETAFERYSYNDRSEVIGSQRFYGSDIDDLSRPVTGRTFGYGYDPIGNRVSSFEDAGGERLTTTYTANELNQYTAIQNPGAVLLRGDAKREAVVTVNGSRVERDSGAADFTPWSYSLSSDDPTAHFQNADILAVAQNATGEDVEQRESGSGFVPATETSPTYDDDGNMTFDGRFRYSWNGENRMIRTEEAVAPTNRAPTVITYAYDEQGRMVAKNIAGTNSVVRSLLWDGYNIVRETDNGMPTYNIWGLDLDGTLQGCGGVGGLLSVTKANNPHVAFYDANGNVSEYVSEVGTISAHYAYSQFGESIASDGEAFSVQFNTKMYCSATMQNEYQLRMYNSKLGRWMSRDPFLESGGINLYCFTINNPICGVDSHGGFIKELFGGIMSVGIGYVTAKILNEPYTLANGVVDFAVGALGPGLIKNIRQFCRARRAMRAEVEITRKVIAFSQETLPTMTLESFESNPQAIYSTVAESVVMASERRTLTAAAGTEAIKLEEITIQTLKVQSVKQGAHRTIRELTRIKCEMSANVYVDENDNIRVEPSLPKIYVDTLSNPEGLSHEDIIDFLGKNK